MDDKSDGEDAQKAASVEAQRGLGNNKGQKKRHKGRRQRRGFPFQVVTANTSGFPQLSDALGGALQGRKADSAIVCQEHHRFDEQLADLHHMARRHQWTTTAIWGNTRRGRRSLRKGGHLYTDRRIYPVDHNKGCRAISHPKGHREEQSLCGCNVRFLAE